MPLLPFEATKKLCERSGWTLSNLSLQKHLFLAQLDYMKTHPDRLIDADFEAWDHGPVVPDVYRFAKRFGADAIENIFHGVSFRASDLDDYLYASYDRLKSNRPWQLVALTHKPGGAWSRNFVPGVAGLKIPDSEIRREALRQTHH